MIEIIPAIDLIGGRCTRLSQGDFSRATVYADDPLTVAKSFADAGLRRLHLVDLDGARSGAPVHLHLLESIAAETGLLIDFSGGIRHEEDVTRAFSAGAAFVGIGSLAVREPQTVQAWAARLGWEKLHIGADVRDGRLAVAGWQEESGLGLSDFIAPYYASGMRGLFCTDISRDGMLGGPATGLYKKLLQEYPSLQLIASGGVSSIDDIAALAEAGCAGVIVGKAIYEGRITLAELKAFVA